MKWVVPLLLLLGLWSCHSRAQAPAVGKEWAATIADRLYERQILSKAGRDELKRQIGEGRLNGTYSLSGTSRYGHLDEVVPATVLQFCAQAFQASQLQRSVSLTERQQREMQEMLRKTPVDTAALMRRFANSEARTEQAIRAEDPPVRSDAAAGWTIYPPLGLNTGSRQDLVAATRSVFGKTRTRTARDLYELGLLSQPDYTQVQQALTSQQLATEASVCQLAAQLAMARFTRPARRVAFDSLLLRLRQAKVLTASGQQQALADPRVNKELSLDALLPYCQQVRVLKGLPREPQRLYPQLLAEAAALLPAFRYTDAQAKLTETPLDKGTSQELVLSFLASSRRYTNHLRLGWQPSREVFRASEQPYVDAEGLAGINQWLRDQHAAERLYLAYLNLNAEETDLPQYALVVLTPAQLLAWGEPGSFSGPEQAADQFTSEHIEEALALYKQLGLFERLPSAELAEGRRQALSGEASSHLDLLRSFPRLVVEMGGEDAELPQAYATALGQVAAATRGAFQPANVQDNFPGQQARKQKSTFSFTCGSQQYHANFVSDLGWMDWGFVTLVEWAVRENTTGRLYYLGEGDETGLYCFLTPTQATALRQAQPELFEADAKEEASKQKK
ncbi:MAG: hypothetical protein ACRYG7_09625 [Janthinobacterium lividum]